MQPAARQQAEQLLADLEKLQAERLRRAGATDPVLFARSLTLIVDGRTVPFQPDPWQCDVLSYKGDRLILNVGRQSGKSTVLAVLALHRALYVPGSLILIISGAQRQSDELFRKVLDFLSRLPFKPRLSEDNKRSIELENRSRIVALPANDGTIRGFSAPAILIEDEAAEVPDDVHVAVRPMLLRSKGKFIMSGTPKGRRGHFFETWERADPALWRKIRLPSEDSSCDKTWLAREKADLARRGMEEIYRQEYECEFIDAASGRVYCGFDEKRNLIDALPKADPANPWIYLCGLDFGITNQNAVSVLAWRRHDPSVYVVEAYRLSGDAVDMALETQSLEARYKFTQIIGDEGGMGKAFGEQMRRRYRIPIQPVEKHNKNGNISLLNGDLRTGRVRVVASACTDLIDEWLQLAWNAGGTKEGPGDNHAADATLYAWRACNAFHQQPLKERPRPGTPDWWAEREKEELEQDNERARRRRSEQGDDWVSALEEQASGF